MKINWTGDEIDASVDAWVEMLNLQKSNQRYRKIDYIRNLINGPLKNRSKGSVEWRFQNITAVAIALDSDWVKGYPPAKNVQPHWNRIQERLQLHGIGSNQDNLDTLIRKEMDRILNSENASELSAFEKYRLKEKCWQLVTKREGQSKFRDILLSAYDSRGAISRADVERGLQAAHIIPYDGPSTNIASNGILLRADIHLLFDSGLIAIDPDDYTTIISPNLENTVYSDQDGRKIIVPDKADFKPDKKFLQEHLQMASKSW